jgi:hypothetical protein
MRAAAVISAAVIAVGVYLALAAMLSVSTSWIALGVLAIAIVASLGVMASERPSERPADFATYAFPE